MGRISWLQDFDICTIICQHLRTEENENPEDMLFSTEIFAKKTVKITKYFSGKQSFTAFKCKADIP